MNLTIKTFAIVVITFCLALGIGWLIWGRHHETIKDTNITHTPATNPVPSPNRAQPRPLPSNVLVPREWMELRSVKDTTLQNNPDLAAEYKSLLAEMDAQQKALEAAMIKADPKVAPIMAKLDQIRKRNTVPRAASASN